MTLTQLAPPYPIFTDKSGSPLDNGYLYFGTANLNPETNPITVYYDRGFTQPVAQPVRTSNGYVMRNGSPALIYANSEFSVTVRDKKKALVIYSPVGFGVVPGVPIAVFDNAANDVSELLANTSFTYSTGVPNTVQVASGDILRTLAEGFAYEVAASGATDQHVTTAGGVKLYVQQGNSGYNVKAFGAIGDGTSNDTAAIQMAVNKVPFGTLLFPTGTFNITSPITIVTDSLAAITRRDRHLVGYGSVINCIGAGQASCFVFSSPGGYPNSSYTLKVEGFTFGGAISGSYISFPNADNFYEALTFENITTTNFATGAGLFFFQNGSTSNLGGVTIQKSAGGPNIVDFLRIKGSLVYGQFNDFTIQDNSHLGTGPMIVLDGSVNSTLLQNSRIIRNFSAGRASTGISGANQTISNSVISSFYSEPKGLTYDSISCDLFSCIVEEVSNQVSSFVGKTIRVIASGGTKDTQFINCRSYNGLTAPWESGVYYDIVIAYPDNVSIQGLIEKYFNNAVSFSRPSIFPVNGQSLRVSNVHNDLSMTAVGTKTIYTFTNSMAGFVYDTPNDIFEIEVSGQLFGGVTNFAMNFELFDGTNTDVLATISTSTLNSNSRLFKMSATIRVNGAVFQALHSEAFFNNAVFTKPPRVYAERGVVVRANNPVLRVNLTTLNSQAVEINAVKITRDRLVSDYSWV